MTQNVKAFVRHYTSLSTFFREKHRAILVGIVSEEKAIGLEDVLSATTIVNYSENHAS